ncbi:MAG: LysR family transcriptional regulator [Lachnospiraceae bacterium]|nr:LysR family transcriptional regulator [Lachnospiraceae bacterium]
MICKAELKTEREGTIMDIRELQYFLEIAREQNITRAAEKLHISQPPLSRQMHSLEEELGVQLFIRGKRKITLTPEGIFLKERAQQLVELSQKTKQQIQEVGNTIDGMLYIGSVESLASGMMPEWIRSFHEAYPKIRFNWSSGNSDDVLVRLDKGVIDVAVVRAPCNDEKFVCISLGREPWAAFFNRKHPLMQEPELEIELCKLDKEPLIIPARKNREREIAGWFHKRGCEANICYQISPVLNAISLVEYNMGVAVLPESTGDYAAQRGISMKRIIDPVMESEILLAYRKDAFLPEAANQFIRFICGRKNTDS